ncbi:hypothetical protein IFM89_025535 [Coptis chinensis]|uniref:PPM-type phosphatase domain-containing protein n=1 Tax=Coptis chinensis TaxID=261450 RepID=A0A835HMM4_9MAGN|nr:hypothetical protein IFM89_025535 [Coptis chinensis]
MLWNSRRNTKYRAENQAAQAALTSLRELYQFDVRDFNFKELSHIRQQLKEARSEINHLRQIHEEATNEIIQLQEANEQIFDGHNGISAVTYTIENLLSHVMSAIPQGIGREEWIQTIPRVLVVDFVKTGETSGTTATLVVIDGLTVTVACVGDSRCILDAQGGVVSLLTIDHRWDHSVAGLVGYAYLGDMDVREHIIPIPHVKQVKVS